MIRPALDAELDDAIAALRASQSVPELIAATNWIRRLLQQMWDETVR